VRPFGRGFLPGPTDVHPDVFRAALAPMYYTFGGRMKALVAGMQPGLQRLFGTRRTVFISTSAATGLMEAAVRGGVRRRVLALGGGYFGELFARVAEGCGKEVVRAEVPFGEALTPEQVERFLDGPPVDAVAVVHSESSTGALADLPGLARVVHARPDVLLLVDAVTSIGAMPVETDAWGLDFVFTGSQKALALPPGIALGAASERYLERARTLDDRGWYLSPTHLLGAAEKQLGLTTPALPVYHALARQLERIEASGGLPARFARHAEMAERMTQWADGRDGVRILAPAGRRSPTVTALELSGDRTPEAVVAELERREWLIATGLPPLGDRVIRIGHMGDLDVTMLNGLLAELETLV
jgi:aspartate aminotransferase-like enzyme